MRATDFIVVELSVVVVAEVLIIDHRATTAAATTMDSSKIEGPLQLGILQDSKRLHLLVNRLLHSMRLRVCHMPQHGYLDKEVQELLLDEYLVNIHTQYKTTAMDFDSIRHQQKLHCLL